MNPEANAAHLNLANAYSDAGRLEEARAAGLIAVERHSIRMEIPCRFMLRLGNWVRR